MPFGGSLPPSDDFFDGLPPLDTIKHVPTASQSLFEGLATLKASRVLYRLAVVDEATGKPMAYPSEADLQRVIEARPSPSAGAAPSPRSPAAASAQLQLAQAQQPFQQPGDQQLQQPSFQTLLAETHKTGGPVCSHCGATESPQWRRGPPNKAILCNACGTRYRRTNQLGSSVPSTQRKRGAQHCASEAMKAAAHTAKQPRIVA